MSRLPTKSPPTTGAWRVHADPTTLPSVSESPGPNRYDDPRPAATDRYAVRYLAQTLRGALREVLAWLRPDHEAEQALAAVDDDPADAVESPDHALAQALADYLATRRVARGALAADAAPVDIHHPATLATLDRDLNVQPLLDSGFGRAALGEPDGRQRPRLDQAAVLLASRLGRRITQHCSLAIWDRRPDHAGIAYRSRHDLTEWCWAIFDFATITFSGPVALSPQVPEHREAVQAVADLWDLPLDAWLQVEFRS